MSAFICSPNQFKQLALFATRRSYGQSLRVDPRYVDGFDRDHVGEGAELASLYADTLYQENIRSVRARYPSDVWDNLPGPITKPLHIIIDSEEECRGCNVTPIEALKMCDCIEYQSCETDDYHTTPAWWLLNGIRRAAIRLLPGYEDARGWEIDDEPTAATA